MLRQAVRLLLNPQGGSSLLGGACSYATQPVTDYALTMKKANEISELAVEKPLPKEIGLSAGIPMETYKRPARIFVSSRNPMQSGFGKTLHDSSRAPQWRIAFDTTGKWENQLMGWTSTADPLENVGRASLFFYTKEEAMDFCTKHGWEFTVDLPNERKLTRTKRFASYGDNFSVKKKGYPDATYFGKRGDYTFP